jgi:uncharacterized protein YgiM (DUF1202 family)
MDDVLSTVESVKKEYAPDKRVDIFNIIPEIESSNIVVKGESTNAGAVEVLMELFEKQNLNVVNEVEILPSAELGEKKYGIINLSVANIRSKPSHPAELATQSLLGTCVNVLKKENGWYLIQTPDKYISWVDADGIHLVDETEQMLWKNSPKVIIKKSSSALYEEPSESSRIVSDLVSGDILKMIETKGEYTKIEFPDGRGGFVANDNFVEYNEWCKQADANQNSILETAFDFIGLPYLWGGTSSKAFDCSGFTKTVYYLNGVILPRDASQQINVGEVVETENDFNKLQKGDLLFFGRKATDKKGEKITHVAIYIGDYKYIHAAGRVRINSLNRIDNDFNEYRLNTFIRAKRIIGVYDKEDNLVKNNPFYN